MELKGKMVILPKKVEGKNGVFTIVKGRLASKNKEGKYVEKFVDVSFDKERFPDELLNKLDENMSYTLDITSAFLIVEAYKDSAFVKIFVKEASLTGEPRPIKKTTDLPF